MQSGLKILFLSTFFPYPLDTGAAIRVNYLLRALAERHTVHLVSFMPRPESETFIPTLNEWGIEVEVLRRDPFRRDPVKAILGHFSLKPRDVIACYSPEMMALATEVSRRQQFDVVIASFTNTAPYALAIDATTKVLEEHNFMTSWMEERYRTQRAWLPRLARWITWQKCWRHERWLYPQFDLCSMVSERDRQAVEKAIPECKGRVVTVPNGVDIEKNQPEMAEPQPDTLVFNGGLFYEANLDAMQYFLSAIMPVLSAARPNLKLKITGRTEVVDLGRLQLNENVILTGYLEDIRPTVAGSWACVVPLRSGGGSRLKILEAMALGVPVISTSKGAEGLEVTPERDLLIADDPHAFTRQTLRLLGDPDLRQRLAIQGRTVVEASYGWDQIAKSFRTLVEAAVQRRSEASR